MTRLSKRQPDHALLDLSRATASGSLSWAEAARQIGVTERDLEALFVRLDPKRWQRREGRGLTCLCAT